MKLSFLSASRFPERLRDPDRAVDFARRAVALDRSPGFLDTLAEAWFAKGLVDEAIKTIEEAIATATENRSYYEKQLKKFSGLAQE